MDARLVASRLPGIAMYGQPFNSPHFPGYLPYGPTDASAFYSPLQAGENAEAWRAGLSQAAAAAYYDPALAAHYGYGYGPMGLSDGARRKNATRETTSTLKAWLNEHRKNPYPTKGEKIMLAIITKMTLTQVSTWFANARRRLKKENKMTWSPRNRCGDDDDDDIMDGDDDSNLNNNSNIQNRDGLSSSGHAGETNTSRGSSPSHSTLGNGPSDGPGRMSSFDLPHQSSHHSFLHRPDISGSFSIRGPSGALVRSSEERRRSSHGEDDEEIDLESVDEERKETAFVKRSNSSESHSQDEANAPLQSRSTVISPPTTSQPQHSVPGLFPHGPHHPTFHPNASNPTAAASLLARHHIQPHVLASMNLDPRNQSQRLHPSVSQHPSSFGPVPSKMFARRNSASPHSHPYSRNAASSPTSSVASSSSATSSPTKPKIWSLADVATSNEGQKSTRSISNSVPNSSLTSSPTPGMAVFAGRSQALPQGLPPHQSLNHDGLAQATIRNWMDGVMQHQQKMAAAAAAAAMAGGQPHPQFFPPGLLPQHLAAALNPAALAVAASLPRGVDGARFQHPFPGFAELAAQRAQMAAHVAELQSQQASPHSLAASSTHAHQSPVSQPLDSHISPKHRIASNNEEKVRSPTASSPAHSSDHPAEVAGFTPLNTRPDSSDSGIVSAETSKDSLSQGNDSTCTK